MIRDIVVAATGTEGDAATLDCALAFAARDSARVTVVVTVEALAPVPSEWGAFPASLYADFYEETRRRAETIASDLQSRLQRSAVHAEVRIADARLLQASRVAAVHARHADLVMMAGPPATGTSAAVENLFVDLSMGSGRPLLLVPAGATSRFPPRHAVLAWQPTREATRAVHDALPLLRGAEAVDVLMIDPRVGEGLHGEQPGADIAAHLARHDLPVRVVASPGLGLGAGEAILRHVRECGADLLVAGAYSRSRLREQILGGVTRDLFGRSTVPVLFSH